MKRLPPGLVAKKLRTWLLLIVAGVFAYGIGLSQGSVFRMKRSVASEGSSLPATFQAAPSELKDSPKNIEAPKSN